MQEYTLRDLYFGKTKFYWNFAANFFTIFYFVMISRNFSQCYFIFFICRNTLYEIYFGKTRDIVNGLRSIQPLADSKQQEDNRKALINALASKNVAKAEWKKKFAWSWLFPYMSLQQQHFNTQWGQKILKNPVQKICEMKQINFMDFSAKKLVKLKNSWNKINQFHGNFFKVKF